MKKLSDQTPIIREAEMKAMSDLQKNWKEYFLAKLNKFNVNSPAELSDKNIKEFFNEIKSDWERGKGATEDGKKDVKEYGVKESVDINEENIKSRDEFVEYAKKVLKKAHGSEYDENKANDTINGIISKCKNNYGACIGMLQSSLDENLVESSLKNYTLSEKRNVIMKL